MPCTSLRGIFSHARNVKKYDALCGLLDRHLLASSNHRGTSSVATMAKAAVDHFGPTSCPVVSKLASTRKDRAEDACHQLLLTYIGIYHPCCKHMHLDYFLCVCVCVCECVLHVDTCTGLLHKVSKTQPRVGHTDFVDRCGSPEPAVSCSATL